MGKDMIGHIPRFVLSSTRFFRYLLSCYRFIQVECALTVGHHPIFYYQTCASNLSYYAA